MNQVGPGPGGWSLLLESGKYRFKFPLGKESLEPGSFVFRTGALTIGIQGERFPSSSSCLQPNWGEQHLKSMLMP